MAELTNPFGLKGTTELFEERRQERRAEANVRRQRLNGVDYSSAELGNAIGRGLRGLLGKAGIMPDPELEKAQKIESAVKRAQVSTRSIPDELRNTDPYGSAIQERKELIAELEASGLFGEADKVRNQIISLKESQVKLSKLTAESKRAQIEAIVEEETAPDRIMKTRADRINADATAQISLVTQAWAPHKAELDYATALQNFEEKKELRPYSLNIKQSEARIKHLEGQLGGPLPGLVKLQGERQNLVNYLTENPDDPWAKKRIQEINEAINTEVNGITRNVDNYQPTTAMLSSVQQQTAELNRARESIGSLIKDLEAPGESLGELAQWRTGAANVVSQFMPLLGFGQEVTSSFAEFIASEEGQLGPQSAARKLRVELLPLVRGGARTTPTDLELLEDLIQATEDATSDRAAAVALMDTLDFVVGIQERNYGILADGLRSIVPANTVPGNVGASAPANTPGPLTPDMVNEILGI